MKGPGGGEPRQRDDVGLRKRAMVLASVIALLALVVGSFFGDRGMLNLATERARAQTLAREVETLRAENARLATDIRALRGDPRAIERLAREELGLARPGEIVFVIRPAAERP